jgi:hypothetical protein
MCGRRWIRSGERNGRIGWRLILIVKRGMKELCWLYWKGSEDGSVAGKLYETKRQQVLYIDCLVQDNGKMLVTLI